MARILLVDDNQLFRSLLRLKLEAVGHEVVEATEGEEALQLHRQAPVDLVLCDLFMPGKEGLETIRELRDDSKTRIIAMSGDGPVNSSDLLRIARILGASETLSKPFDMETMLEAVRNVLAPAQ